MLNLAEVEGHKKTKEAINEYLADFLNCENEHFYSLLECPFWEKDEYLLLDKDYVFYTEIEIPEKIYIATDLKEEDGNYEVQIYEYDVTDSNRWILERMLEKGKIYTFIKKANEYTITGTNKDGTLTIQNKIVEGVKSEAAIEYEKFMNAVNQMEAENTLTNEIETAD